jgi:hypothetical protein
MSLHALCSMVKAQHGLFYRNGADIEPYCPGGGNDR